MIKYKVSYKIGDIVEHSFNEMKFKVVGYNIIGDKIQYICLQSLKTEFCYMNEIELKPIKDVTIGFIHTK